jgi:cell division protein FtsI (penicillin-binding protein 3)
MAAERELHKAVEEAQAAAGWAVVMDVKSGAVLALAGSPAFDANQPGRDPEVWRNRAVQEVLEPGSTIKSFVVAWAVEKGLVSRDTQFFCENGAWRRGRRTIHDTHKIGMASVADVLRLSSNICAAKIGELLGAQKMVAGLRSFGFGERTSVGLPGEPRGTLRDPARMKPIEVDTTAFGQGMSATGLQTVAAMAAIANGGVLLRPFLVEKVVAPDGKVLLSRGRTEVRRVLRPETAQVVSEMLEEVTRKGGTGTRAAIADFRVAGKTGTAQKVDLVNGGYGDKRLGSFLGFVPAEAPRLAILVAIDEPEGRVFGGEIAAPAWGAIAAEALRQLDVHPQRIRESAEMLAVSSFLPPSADEEAAAPEQQEIPAGKALVPDVAGLPARSAIRRLAESQLEPELKGSGRAVSQQPSAGSIVQRGARVRVTLAPAG